MPARKKHGIGNGSPQRTSAAAEAWKNSGKEIAPERPSRGQALRSGKTFPAGHRYFSRRAYFRFFGSKSFSGTSSYTSTSW